MCVCVCVCVLTSVSLTGGKELSGEDEVGLGDWTGAESDRVWKELGGLIRRAQELVACLRCPNV